MERAGLAQEDLKQRYEPEFQATRKRILEHSLHNKQPLAPVACSILGYSCLREDVTNEAGPEGAAAGISADSGN